MSTLYVDRRNIDLELESGAIVFREHGVRAGTVPIAPLTRVFLRGDVRLPASLLGALGDHGIGVVVLSGRQGKPSLLLGRPGNDARRRVAQIRQSLDERFCLVTAQRLIDTKLEQQIRWFDELREHDRQARYPLTHALRLLTAQQQRLTGADTLASLRGLEGVAAACYFEGLKAVLPESLHFTGRNRRPPRDPFNVLLSLNYTLLQAELAIALYGAGLDPYVGFYHQLDFGRESLACDLLEPLRPLADRFALNLLKKQILRIEDFTCNHGACLLGKAGRIRYYEAYEQESEALRAGIETEVTTMTRCIEQGTAGPAPCTQEGTCVNS